MQKPQWLMDLLTLCIYHEHFNKDVLMKAWGISEELAIEIITETVFSKRKLKFIKDTQAPPPPN